MLQKKESDCFNYQHVDGLYTIFKSAFSCKLVVKIGELFDNVQRAVQFNRQSLRVERKSSIAKKES